MFRRLVDALDMQILSGPNFIEVPLDTSKLKSDTFQDDGGITGFMVISTSHVSIHCRPLRNFFSMDVFSCKNFDAPRAIGVIKEHLGLDRVNISNVDRTEPFQA